MDQRGCAADDKDLGFFGGLASGGPRVLGKGFAEPDDAGADGAAAAHAAGWIEAGAVGWQLGDRGRGRVALAAALAVGSGDLAVEMQDVLAARAFVEIVDVLRDQRKVGRLLLELCNGVMRGVGRGLQNLSAAPFIPSPDEGGIAREGVGGGEFHRVVVFPETGLLVAKGGDAALGGDAGAR